MNDKTDIIVVGCGIVGSTVALLLADIGFSVRVLDTKTLESNNTLQKTAWVSSLNLSSEQVLRSIGVDFKSLEDDATPITALNVKDVNAGSINFSASSIAKSHLATIVDNARLLQELWSRIKAHANIIINSEAEIIRVDNSDAAHVYTTNSEYEADLLLAADGARSKLRTMAGIAYTEESYGHTALVATIKTQLAHNNIGRQWFHASGPLAFLPIDNNNSHAIVWSQQDAAKWIDLDRDKLAQVLTEMSGSDLGSVSSCENLLAFPLTERHAQTYFSNRVCLIGDAAHSIHPLAGQGANLGVADALCLAKVLQSAKDKSTDLASRNVLLQYQRERRSENILMLRMMQFLKSSTSQTDKFQSQARALAINLVDKSAILKRLFMQAAE